MPRIVLSCWQHRCPTCLVWIHPPACSLCASEAERVPLWHVGEPRLVLAAVGPAVPGRVRVRYRTRFESRSEPLRLDAREGLPYDCVEYGAPD